MTTKTNLTICTNRDLFNTSPKAVADASVKCRSPLMLPIESKRSVIYVNNPVGRTVSTDSTDASPTLSDRSVDFEVEGKADECAFGLISCAPVKCSGDLQKRATRTGIKKSVSWVPVDDVRVVHETIPTGKGDDTGASLSVGVAAFVNKLRNSQKHVDTIYVYQSTSHSDDADEEWSDEDESKDFRFLSNCVEEESQSEITDNFPMGIENLGAAAVDSDCGILTQ